jgi:hypothetical protein
MILHQNRGLIIEVGADVLPHRLWSKSSKAPIEVHGRRSIVLPLGITRIECIGEKKHHEERHQTSLTRTRTCFFPRTRFLCVTR